MSLKYSVEMDYGAGFKHLLDFDMFEDAEEMHTELGDLLSRLTAFAPRGFMIRVEPTMGKGNA